MMIHTIFTVDLLLFTTGSSFLILHHRTGGNLELSVLQAFLSK